jgi:hypothetical protein
MAYVREQGLGFVPPEAVGAAVAVVPQALREIVGLFERKKRRRPPQYFAPPAPAEPVMLAPPAGGPFGLPGWVFPAVVIGGLGVGAIWLLRPAPARAAPARAFA